MFTDLHNYYKEYSHSVLRLGAANEGGPHQTVFRHGKITGFISLDADCGPRFAHRKQIANFCYSVALQHNDDIADPGWLGGLEIDQIARPAPPSIDSIPNSEKLIGVHEAMRQRRPLFDQG